MNLLRYTAFPVGADLSSSPRSKKEEMNMKTMKPALILASLLIIPVAYANNARAADAGCDPSCQQAYDQTMAQEKTLKAK